MNVLAETSFNLSQAVESTKGLLETLGPLGRGILAIIVFFIGKKIAKWLSGLLEKSLHKTSIDNKMAKYIGADNGSIEKVLASLIHGVLLLFVIIFALDIAGLRQVVEPLNDLFKTFLSAIPNLLTAAIVLYLGTVLANIVKSLLKNVLVAAKIDDRVGSKPGTNPIADAISVAAYCFVLLIFASVALSWLGMKEISEPISAIISQILSAVPRIIVAGVLIAVGVLIGQIAQKLVTNLLKATGIDYFPAKLGLSVPTEGKSSISSIAGFLVFLCILVLLITSAINALDIELLSKASEGFLVGFYNVLLAVLIFGAGLVGAKFAKAQLIDKSRNLANVVYGLILFVVSIVALNRSGIAPDITGLPFTVIVVAAGVAFGIGGAIAIGLGARGYVSRFLEKRG